MLFGASAALLAVILVGVAVVAQILGPQDLFYGTFTNANMPIQEVVRFPGGFKNFMIVSDTVPRSEGTERIVEQWKDSAGNSWYRTQAVQNRSKYLTLQRISRSGTVLEFAVNEVADFLSGGFPERLEPGSDSYRIYNRAGEQGKREKGEIK
jgi:hypothetical protein